MPSPSKLFVSIVVPYFVGICLSKQVLPENVVTDWMTSWMARALVLTTGNAIYDTTRAAESPYPAVLSNECEQNFRTLLGVDQDVEDPFSNVAFHIHRNGETQVCGDTSHSSLGFWEELKKTYDNFFVECPSNMDKFYVEALLTEAFNNMVDTCLSLEHDGDKKAGFLGFCDMGPKKTPILLDHEDLQLVFSPKTNKTSLPCRFHTREGLRITQLSQLTEMAKSKKKSTNTDTVTSSPQEDQQQQCQSGSNGEDSTCEAAVAAEDPSSDASSFDVHLYAVPAGRVFMFAPSYVGEIFHLPHVEGSDERTIYLEVMSLEPRVFDVYNFFSREESAELVERAQQEQRDSHKIKRSSTGPSGYNINSRRTSESGFDTNGKTALKVKQRCFKALGFDEYWESFADGLQILRYNVSTSYNSHMDYIEDKAGTLEHDYDSAGAGGNRFATILMYMSDMGPEDGGETVFPEGWPPHVEPGDRSDVKTEIKKLRESKHGDVLKHGSWEESLVGKCRTRLAVRPHSSRAVLFYSQFPNGKPDPASLHGACPVLSGQKYAANLWVWNTPRAGYSEAPVKEKFRKAKEEKASSSPSANHKTVRAVFKNSAQDPNMANAELFYNEDHFWCKLGHGDNESPVNTYTGHEWNIKVDGKVVKTIHIDEKNGLHQEITI